MLDEAYSDVGTDFNVNLLAVAGTDTFDRLLCAKRPPPLREDENSGERNAALSDALARAVNWTKELRNPAIVEDLDSMARAAAAQLSTKGTRLIYAKYSPHSSAADPAPSLAAANVLR